MSEQSADADALTPKFDFGRFFATPKVLTTIPNDEITKALARHLQGDWGTLDAHDLNENKQALKYGGRLFSQYHSTRDVKFWIITEADRSVTTVLLPEDY